VYSYLLMAAAYKDHVAIINGQTIIQHKGEVITGRKSLSEALVLSEKEIRTALKILKNLNFVAITGASKFSVVSVINFDSCDDDGPTKGPAEGPQKGQQGASRGPQQKKEKNKESISPQPPEGAIEFQPPSIEDVDAYIKLKGYRVDAREFVETNAANGWTWKKGNKRLPIKNWKQVLGRWNINANKYAPRKEPLVLEHAEDMRKINSVVMKCGPWFPLDDESDADFEKRFEEMVAECVARGVDETYVREGR